MYSVPELNNTDDYGCDVPGEEVQEGQQRCIFRSSVACDTDIHNLCCHMMAQNNLQPPEDPYQAIDLYMELRNFIIMSQSPV